MEKKLLVEGMMCNHCKATVEKTLNALEGVKSAEVNLEEKTVRIVMDQDIPDTVIMEAVRSKGFNPVRFL